MGQVVHEDKGFVPYILLSICLREEYFNNGLNWRKREGACSESLDQVIDGSVDRQQGHLLVRVETLGALSFLEESSYVLHELVVVEVNTNSRLQLVQVVLLKEDLCLWILIVSFSKIPYLHLIFRKWLLPAWPEEGSLWFQSSSSWGSRSRSSRSFGGNPSQ